MRGSDRRTPGADRLPAGPDRWFAEEGSGLRFDAEALDLRRLLGVLWRRRLAILSVIFSVTALTVLYVLQLTPLYTAEAKIVRCPT